MSVTWILVANTSKAQLYSTIKAKLFSSNGDAEKSLNFLKEFTHEQSRKKTSDLVTDKVGSFQGGTGGHGSFLEAVDPKKAEAERFAIELAFELEEARKAHKFDDLVLVTTAHFQSLINKHLQHPTQQTISTVIHKDYTKFNERDLALELREQI